MDTIAALATPAGRGGVGIIRVSGNLAKVIAEAILKKIPTARYAEYLSFKDASDQILDEGIALFFPGPHSYTGEDVLELQGHGGPVVMDLLLQQVLKLGARLAQPGEFTQRAFLNDKIDLAQAEAIADLIDSTSERAAKSAMRSLQGEFSKQVHAIVDALTQLRMYVEATIDFSDEDIDFISSGNVAEKLKNIQAKVNALQAQAAQGAVLREGLHIVIAGKPNAGKSTLLNALSGRESAIVTDVPGTTRDVMREYILIDGVPFYILDTAGLRETHDKVEKEGVRRAWDAINKADAVLLIVDGEKENPIDFFNSNESFLEKIPNHLPITFIVNKIDLMQHQAECCELNQEKFKNPMNAIYLSAKQQQGIELLRQHLKNIAGIQSNTEGGFIARRRHLHAIEKATQELQRAEKQLQTECMGELLAEDLRQAQQALATITGEFTADDLLGEIFSKFCIGK